MKLKGLLIGAVAGVLLLSSHQAVAWQPAITIEVLATFDYPGTGNSTTATGINDQGDVAGYFEDTSGAVRSFIRYADGTFSAPIVEPNDTGNFTLARDIDNSGHICGFYFDGSDVFHPYRGFFLSGTTFTELDGFGGTNSYVTGVTDAGDFCGFFNDYPNHEQCFLFLADGGNVGWVINNFSEANAVNIHTATVGDSMDASGYHGFLRDPVFPFARIISPVDYPGSTDTFVFGLNDGGRIIVGKYVDSVGATHGLILRRPNTFSSFDYPGATETSLNGINNLKLISGYYADALGIRHGFIARVDSH